MFKRERLRQGYFLYCRRLEENRDGLGLDDEEVR